MDPNATLDNLRNAIKMLRDEIADGDSSTVADLADDVADAAEALDTWLAQGGVLPTAWQIPGVR